MIQKTVYCTWKFGKKTRNWIPCYGLVDSDELQIYISALIKIIFNIYFLFISLFINAYIGKKITRIL
jgi:hypothetical protein